ncbi:cysteine desulfurase family protein [Azospira inquinata]|uniref:Cysteine desulfurase n=1 Tax=Azospira inquinata TaxID=2785627 RepID=A0A975SMH1_9RHOO|nr:cysteine desulfurase family protein [Azospira inquinata]QWT45631.1 cysteine desulfurase [Azospira inquinata]QWT49045.1 cysteine desulfurase [Azospira inquinata]
MFAPVYFDHNATTPLAPEVLEAMLPYLRDQYGNPSSRHEYGRAARRAVEEARAQVAEAVGAHPTEVIFTSGGSETNNLFLKGAAACRRSGWVVVSGVEHPCVLEPARQLGHQGWQVHELAVDGDGRVAEADFAIALARRPNLISVMLANNETGVVQDVAALAERAKGAGSPWFHSDAIQALGKLPLDFRALNAAGVHALTLSAHKIGGPKGAAALVLDKRVELAPLIAGGGQERNLRSGTENVAAIVGFGAACALSVQNMEQKRRHLQDLRQALEAGLGALGATVFGAGAPRLPNTSFFAFPGLDGETLVGQLDRAGFAVASGSACSSVQREPSHVLLSMGVAPDLAKGAVRVSLGRENTAAQVQEFLAALGATLQRLTHLAAIAV